MELSLQTLREPILKALRELSREDATRAVASEAVSQRVSEILRIAPGSFGTTKDGLDIFNRRVQNVFSQMIAKGLVCRSPKRGYWQITAAGLGIVRTESEANVVDLDVETETPGLIFFGSIPEKKELGASFKSPFLTVKCFAHWGGAEHPQCKGCQIFNECKQVTFENLTELVKGDLHTPVVPTSTSVDLEARRQRALLAVKGRVAVPINACDAGADSTCGLCGQPLSTHEVQWVQVTEEYFDICFYHDHCLKSLINTPPT